MIRKMMMLVCLCVIIAGCGNLRFAPGETQKQNAWLHNRTAEVTSQLAQQEGASVDLQALTKLGEKQSRAFVSYFGLPDELPQAETTGEILSQANVDIAEAANVEAAKRPDGWELADALLELGIGLSGLFGGVYGARVVSLLGQARERSKALQEIVAGNELFKQQNASSVEAFKAAHSEQSTSTRKIVAELKA
jgi:hypothetical protein